MRTTNVVVIAIICILVNFVACNRSPKIDDSFRISFAWSNGKVTKAGVVTQQGEPVASSVRNAVLSEANEFISDGVKQANLQQASGQIVLYLSGNSPYFSAVRDFEITEPDFSILRVAVETGDVTAVRSVVAKYHNVNQRELVSQESALIYAAMGGQVDCVRALLTLGADPKLPNNIGTTPLMFAAMNGNADSVRILLAHGADKSAHDQSGNSALSYAKLRGHNDLVAILE